MQPTASAVRDQLERIEKSAEFSNSERLTAFLRFVVDATLRGERTTLKESVIGNAVYGREPSYDSRIDSTVRVEARRLRRKLGEYYDGPGRNDPIRITLPVGTYVPWFSEEASSGAAADDDASSDIFRKGTGATVVVLPMRALSSSAEDETFAAGLTDELIYALARADGLRIASRGTAFLHSEAGRPLPALAADLGADAFLQGTVRSDDGTIRVTVELSDPQGFVAWSDRFDVRDQDRLIVQERIAATLLSRLRLDSSRMRAKLIGPGPVALAAKAKIGRARQLVDQQSPAALYEALQHFQQVARSAPDYARPHSGIADCHCDLYRVGIIDPATARAAATAAVERALQIDPESVEAHCSRATVSAWIERDRLAAEDHFQRALRLGENARAARLYAILLTIVGRHEDAERLFWDARAIEPFALQQDIAEAIAHYQARRFSACIEVGSHGIIRRPSPEVAVHRALASIFGGDEAGAHAAMQEIEQTTVKHPDLAFSRLEIPAWLGEHARARAALDSSSIDATWYARATLAASIHDDDLALSALQTALDRRELSSVWIRSDARFDRLRNTPAFDRLLAQVDDQRRS